MYDYLLIYSNYTAVSFQVHEFVQLVNFNVIIIIVPGLSNYATVMMTVVMVPMKLVIFFFSEYFSPRQGRPLHRSVASLSRLNHQSLYPRWENQSLKKFHWYQRFLMCWELKLPSACFAAWLRELSTVLPASCY